MKIKGFYLYQWLCVVTCGVFGLGFVITIAGINIAYFMTFISGISIVLHSLNDRKMFFRAVQGKKKYFLFLFVFWVIYGAILGLIWNAFSNEYGVTVYKQLVTNAIIVVFLCFIVIDTKSYRLVRNVMLIDLIFNVISGMIEVVFRVHYVEAESIWDANNTRGFDQNPNEYAVLVGLLLSCIILFAIESKLSVIGILLVVLAAICIRTSNCRGIFYAIIVFAISYLFAFLYYKIGGHSLILRYTAVLFIAVVILLLFSGQLLEILREIVAIISKGGDVISDNSRIWMISECMKLFEKSHGFGVGPGQSIVFLKINPHNLWAEILAEYGLIIFISVMLPWWIIFKRSFNSHYSIRVRCLFFAFIPYLAMVCIPSSSTTKFKMFWIVLFMFYILDEYVLQNSSYLQKTGENNL